MPGATRPAVGAHEHAVGVRLHAGAGSAEFTGSARATRYGPGVPDDQMPTDEVETAVDGGADDGVSTGDTFAFFSLEGDRFNAPGMPADATREIAAYREALVAIATDLWRQANPGAGRAPNGFAGAFDLRLTAIKAGSAQPQLVLNRPVRGVSDAEWSEWVQFYEQARDLATARVHEVETQDAVPADMGRIVHKALKRVGSTLDGTDRLRLGSPRPGTRRRRSPLACTRCCDVATRWLRRVRGRPPRSAC